MARHLIAGAVIDDEHPLSVIAGGPEVGTHLLDGNIIDADHPLAVRVVTEDVPGGHLLKGAWIDDQSPLSVMLVGASPARHNLFGAVIGETHPLSITAAPVGVGAGRQVLSGAVIDALQPLAVFDVGWGGESFAGLTGRLGTRSSQFGQLVMGIA